MKKIMLYVVFIWLFVSTGLAYTYEVYTYGPSKNLKNAESILIDELGGMYGLILEGQSSANIKGTSPLSEGSGGIWQMQIVNNSSIYMTNGEVHEIDISHNATATLKGGLIESIYSYQSGLDPHITLYYSGDLPTVQEIDGLEFLVGQWGDGADFSIYLHDTGYDVYGNFDFILVPEPATLALVGLGGLLLRRKHC